MSITTRFAPSPTGVLHLGHAYAALFAWRRARRAGGRFLLRIEDIDPVRCRPDYAAAIIEDLTWIGLDWDGPVRVQSEHLPEYAAVLETLAARGLTYPCFCTRADIARAASAPHGPDGIIYPGTCRALSHPGLGRPHAIRLNIGRALAETGPLTAQSEDGARRLCDPARFGDIVLARRDAPASYHLCAAHDDAAQGVTLVTRGIDLEPATDIHRLLQALLGWPEPRYHHHRLILDSTGRRLAKRDAAATLHAIRASGVSAAEIRAQCED